MKSAIVLALSLALLGACENKNKKEAEESKSTSAEHGEARAEEAPVADSSSLWQFAPSEAVFGIVVADGALGRGFDAALELKRIVSSVPTGKELAAKMDAEITAGAPFNVIDKAAYAKQGLDLSKGAAFFIGKDEQPVMVLPVGDRAAFKNLTKAKTETVEGVEYDRIDKAYCLEKNARYVCATSPESLDGKAGPLAERAKSLPKNLRGDIELVALIDQIPEAQEGLDELSPAITGVKTGVLSARMAAGRLVVRGWLQGTPPEPVAKGLAAIPSAEGLRKLGGGATSVYSMRIPIEATGLLSKMPPSMPIAGFDFRAGLVEQLTGEFAGYFVPSDSPLGFGYVVGVGMKDTSAFKAALPNLCKMGAAAPGLSVTSEGSSCKGTFDPKMIPDPSVRQIIPSPVPVKLELRDKLAIIAIGAEPVEGLASAQAGGTASRSMLNEAWNGVIWGRWADPFGGDSGLATTLFKQAMSQAPADMLGFVAISRVVMAHVFETGFAFKLDDQGAHLVAEFTTMAADADDAYGAYSKLVSEAIASDKSYTEGLAELAKKHPKSLVAKQAAMAQSGAPSLAFFTGVGAAIAIPAFMKYVKKSKSSEAQWMVRRMADGARAYHAANGKLPASAKMTPKAGSCCPDKCAPAAQQWSQSGWSDLQFSVEDPHFYSYEFKNKGKAFEAIAVGDLDCDGVFSTYTLEGKIKGKDVELGFIRQENELE